MSTTVDYQATDEIDGATHTGQKAAYPSTPGEFAARWNSWTPQRREAWLNQAIQDAQTATRCFEQDHEGMQTHIQALHAQLGRNTRHPRTTQKREITESRS